MGLETFSRDYTQLKSDLRGVFSLISALPKFFCDPISPQRAEEEIKKGLDTRERRFLDLVRARIYDDPKSPYRQLLRFAGCEFSDLHANVARCGLEKTLERLAAEGVYLTAEEFKGKKPVVRGRQILRVTPADFEQRGSSAGFQTQSSGTSNEPIRSFVSLDLLAIRAPVTCLFFVAHGLFSRAHAMYDSILPGAAALNNLLIYAKMGVVAERWFARAIPSSSKIEGLFHHVTTELTVLAARHFGPGFPKPECIETHETERIVRWIAGRQRQNQMCCITTAASNAARIARAATRLGISLVDTKFIVSGEPFTEAKHEVIKEAGATATARYAYGGSINVGFGCANPLQRDEIHVNQHLLALCSNSRSLGNGGSPIYPLLCTTLHPAFPRLLLNVESGDYGYLTQRHCGCAMDKAGLSLHLHHIRSFEKFTSEGMNYFYGDLFELFEKMLPAEFGGGPGDYQLVEEEDEQGQTRLTLRVHPEVGEINASQLLSRLQEALAEGSRGNRFMSSLWQDAGTFRIKRDIPHASGRGKILPLHINHGP